MTDHVYWKEGSLYVLDQRLLPFRLDYLRCDTLKDVTKAIKNMAVRGAPLIGIVAAYGVVIGMQEMARTRGHLSENRRRTDVPEAERDKTDRRQSILGVG